MCIHLVSARDTLPPRYTEASAFPPEGRQIIGYISGKGTCGRIKYTQALIHYSTDRPDLRRSVSELARVCKHHNQSISYCDLYCTQFRVSVPTRVSTLVNIAIATHHVIICNFELWDLVSPIRNRWFPGRSYKSQCRCVSPHNSLLCVKLVIYSIIKSLLCEHTV